MIIILMNFLLTKRDRIGLRRIYVRLILWIIGKDRIKVGGRRKAEMAASCWLLV
jgi:hypothetical protein